MNIKEKQVNGYRPTTSVLRSQFPSMFDDFFMKGLFSPSFATTGVSTPYVNIIESRDDFRVEMVAPGMKKEAFNVQLENQVLTISYDHGDNREGDRKDWKYLVHEYNYHSFARSFSLPDTVEPDKIEANYVDGILTLIIPKKEEAKPKPPRQIAIG